MAENNIPDPDEKDNTTKKEDAQTEPVELDLNITVPDITFPLEGAVFTDARRQAESVLNELLSTPVIINTDEREEVTVVLSKLFYNLDISQIKDIIDLSGRYQNEGDLTMLAEDQKISLDSLRKLMLIIDIYKNERP